MKFKDVVSAPDLLMGVKAVWGNGTASLEAVMGFGSHGDEVAKNRGYFSLARLAAEKAQTQPYLITIGAGQGVGPERAGRVIELMHVTDVYGETKAIVRDAEAVERLARWPVAVYVSEVYEIIGYPLLIEDLGFPDRRIMNNAYDSIRRDDEQIKRLFNALVDRPIRYRNEVHYIPDIDISKGLKQCSTYYPKISRAEGEARYAETKRLERDANLAAEVKERNRDKNTGLLSCGACGFSDEMSGLFDAHHSNPLMNGPRISDLESFIVLCPTCHRWAHCKSEDRKKPLSIDKLRLDRSIFGNKSKDDFLEIEVAEGR